jgi:hypothetical protein
MERAGGFPDQTVRAGTSVARSRVSINSRREDRLHLYLSTPCNEPNLVPDLMIAWMD